MARSKLTFDEMRRRNDAVGEGWFDPELARRRRRRIESDPVRMEDGGCVFVITEQDAALRGEPHSRISQVVRFCPDGRIMPVDLGWHEDTPAARRAAKAYARGELK